jgi:CIC family chloride channel protein
LTNLSDLLVALTTEGDDVRLRFGTGGDGLQSSEAQQEYIKLSILAVFIGLVVAFIAVLFRHLVDFIFVRVFLGGGETLSFLGPAQYAIIPAIGGLIVGPIIYYWAREAKGHGVPEVMDSVIRFGGRIRLRVVGVKGIASAITIGTGGSSGREGPIVHMGSAVGSNIAQMLKMTPARTKILLGCGAAAGITATFNTPIAGVLFALEIILMEFKTRSFIPIVISSVVATLVAPMVDAAIIFFQTGTWTDNPWAAYPAFDVPTFTLVSPWELLAYLGLGIICGLLALLYIKFLYRTEDFFDAMKAKPWIKPAIGGLLLGGVGIVFPMVHGVGYESVEEVLNGRLDTVANPYLIGLMAAMALVKILGVSLTLGSGGSGGIFAPALFIGAMAGGSFGATLNHFFPDSTAMYGAYGLVAMAALVAASTRGTLTAILMIFEMTRVYEIILPLLFACVIADMVASLGSPETIYTRKLLRRGVKIVHDLEPNVMQLFSVKDVMVQREDVVTVGPEDQLHKVVAIIRRTGHNGFPVLDDDKKLVGIVTHEDTRNAHNKGELFLKAKEFMTTDMVTVTPYQTGEEALRAMGDRRVSHLPVVDPYDRTKLLGWLSKGDVVFAYDDYHRRMDAPFCDDDGVAVACEDEELATEEVLEPPSLASRIFKRKGKKTEKAKDIGSEGDDGEAFEVEIYESEVPKGP